MRDIHKRAWGRRAAVVALAGALAIPLYSQAQAPAAASAAGAAAAPRPTRPPPPPPVTDLTGTWIVPNPEPGKPPLRTLQLIQKGSDVISVPRINEPGSMLAGLPPFNYVGMIEGDQVDMMAWFYYQGGELSWLRGTYKDGHLLLTRKSIHSKPSKFRLDGTFEEDYVRAPTTTASR